MNKLKTILVAVDFSTGSHAALEQAARAAVVNNAALHVLHVVDSVVVSTLAEARGQSYDSQAETAAQGARLALDRWIAQAGVGVPCQRMIVVGTPLQQILEHARALKAGLLVAGLEGAGKNTPGAGSVAAKLARKARIPVLLVRGDQGRPFKKIVACIDFSAASAEVALQAQRVALQHRAAVDFLHVWQEPWVVAYPEGSFAQYSYPAVIFTKQERQQHIENLRALLHEQVADAALDVPCAEVLREAPSPAPGIADHAQACLADLIVLGSTGSRNLRDVLLGSTAERLLHRTHCSVLVVRSPAR